MDSPTASLELTVLIGNVVLWICPRKLRKLFRHRKLITPTNISHKIVFGFNMIGTYTPADDAHDEGCCPASTPKSAKP